MTQHGRVVGEADPGQTERCGWPLLFFFPLLDVARYLSVVAQLRAAKVRTIPTNHAAEGKLVHLLFPARIAVSAPLAVHLSEQHPRGAQLSLSFLLTVVSC